MGAVAKSSAPERRQWWRAALVAAAVALVVAVLVVQGRGPGDLDEPLQQAVAAATAVDGEIAEASEALSRLREALLVGSPGEAVARFDPTILAVSCRRGDEGEIFAASSTAEAAQHLESRPRPAPGEVVRAGPRQVVLAGGSHGIRSYALLDLSGALSSREGREPRLVEEPLPPELARRAQRHGWITREAASARPEIIASSAAGLLVTLRAPPPPPLAWSQILLWSLLGLSLATLSWLALRPQRGRGGLDEQEQLLTAAVELVRAAAVSPQVEPLLSALERALNASDRTRWRLVRAEAIEAGDVGDVGVPLEDLRGALARAMAHSHKDSAVTRAVRAPDADGHGRTLFVVRDVGEVHGVAIAEGDLTGDRLSRGAELLLRIAAASLRTATLLERLVASEQHAAVGRLAAGVAHEVNNPLAYIVMNLRALETTSEGDRLQAIHEALEGAERIEHIIRGLRVLFRGSSELVLRRVDMLELLQKTTRFAGARRVGTPIDLDADSALWVDGDEVGLGQILLNLMTNAVDAVAAVSEPKVTVRLFRDSATVVVEVEDNGPGVSPALQSRLFDAFVSSKGQKGTGLGLGIARSFARAHGGEVTLHQSQPGSTVFRFTISESRARPSASPPPEAMSVLRLTPSSSVRPRVLLIDDEVQLIRAMKRWLDEVVEITGTTSALEALDLLEEQAPFSLILCDLNMPKMSGVEFVGALRERDPEHAARVVIMTGSIEAELPDIQVVTKPVSPDIVRELIESHSGESAGQDAAS